MFNCENAHKPELTVIAKSIASIVTCLLIFLLATSSGQASSIGFSGYVGTSTNGKLAMRSPGLTVFGNQAAIGVTLQNRSSRPGEIRIQVISQNNSVLPSNVNQGWQIVPAGGRNKMLVVFQLEDAVQQMVRICSSQRKTTGGWKAAKCDSYQVTRADLMGG